MASSQIIELDDSTSIVSDDGASGTDSSTSGTETGNTDPSAGSTEGTSESTGSSTMHDSTCIGIASLVVKSVDGQVGHVNSLTDNDITKLNNMISNISSLDSDVTVLENKIIISSEDPSGGVSGQLWFKYEA